MSKIEKLEGQIVDIESRMSEGCLCEGTASVSSRISGYYRDTENWNDGKKSEFEQRTEYEV